MKEIGGYFGLELGANREYHDTPLRLNTGRNCLEYILKAKGYRKIYLPYYICDLILEPLNKLGIDYEFYHVDENLDPVFDKILDKKEVMLCVNYFGLKQKSIERLARHNKNLIVDNTQAFFSRPINEIDTFYSARKFFGVADGAYLYTDRITETPFGTDVSYDRMAHLLKRIDLSGEDGYSDFRSNDNALMNQPIRQMSKLTRSLLSNIDYEKAKLIREQNFMFMHEALQGRNALKFDFDLLNGPMVYPLVSPSLDLREKMIGHRIYVSTYWLEVLSRVDAHSVEANFVNYLVAIPIDQRYSQSEMKYILSVI